jgi:hypothetical protein
MLWYRRVFDETDDLKQLDIVVHACLYYEAMVPDAKAFLSPPDGLITKVAMMMPGITAENYSRMTDLEIMLEHVTNYENRVKGQKVIWYLEHYQRALSDTQAKNYADVSDEVQAIRSIRNRVASVRNEFLGISKGLEVMHFQLSNVTKLKAVGLEDATF